MAGFDINDLYTVSAGVLLSDYWNPFVTKHDTSSFYNWEQDNLPLYDLEERTDYLWEKLGWPTSSLPGMVLAVSSSIPTHLDVSCNFFLDVSSAIKALPEILHMPVMIEVCTSGNLGKLELDNIKCMGDGALEIVNRASARIIGSDLHQTPADFSSVVYGTDVNGLGSVTSLSSNDYQNIVADVSCLLASSNDVEIVQTGVNVASRGFAQVRPHMATNAINARHLADSVGHVMNTVANPNEALFLPIGKTTAKYTNSLAIDTTVDDLDSSCITSYDDTVIVRSAPDVGVTVGHGFTTSNYLTRVKVQNCDGPIYIRNFIVDPAEDEVNIPYSYSHSYEEGAVISNSSEITLENFGVMRARGTGILLENSKVDLKRGFASSRNYTHPSSTTRSESFGVKAYNSTINVKSDTYVSGSEFLFNIQENTVGLYLHNSILTGGDSFEETDNGTFPEPTVLNFFSNKTNIEAVNSEISMKGLVTCYNGDKGIRATNSTLIIDGLNLEANEKVGMELINSHVRYAGSRRRQSGNLLAYGAEGGYFAHIPYNYQIAFADNGQHLSMVNSTFKLDDTETNHPDTAPSLFFANHHGSDSFNEPIEETLAPAIHCDNSLLELAHSRMFCPQSAAGSLSTEFDINLARNVKGVLINAENNSRVDLHGSKYGATQLVGPKAYAHQTKSTGVYAGNNSTVRFMGPTFIGQFAVDAMADKHSSVEFCPHKNLDGGLSVSGWDLSSGLNHTMVELHATRSCLVADNGSVISMRDLGDYHTSWNRDALKGSVSAADYGTGTEGQVYNCSAYYASGGLIFLPNPDESLASLQRHNLAPSFSNKVSPEANLQNHGVFNTPSLIGSSTYYSSFLNNPYATMTEDEFSAVSLGGFCVRASNSSKVDSLNVHFVPGPNNTDKEYYDPLAPGNNAGCYNLRIWNLGQGSHLNAAYCSVSGTYPGTAPYWGPRSVWQKPGTTWYTDQGRANTSAIGETAFSGINYATSGDRFGTDVDRYDPEFKNYSILDSFGESVHLNSSHTLSYAGISTAKSEYLINNSLTINDYSAGGSLMLDTTGGNVPQHTNVDDTVGYNTSAYRWFGMNGSNGPFNRGPFRLYFSTKPSAHLLCPSGSVPGDNTVVQSFSQGYHASGDCSAINDEIAVLTAPELMIYSGSYWNEQEDASYIDNQDAWGFEGYYHVKDFVDPTFRERVVIDESASNTFANAKHCSHMINGRPALLKIHRATTTEEGQGHSPSLNGKGRGFRTSNIFDIDRKN